MHLSNTLYKIRVHAKATHFDMLKYINCDQYNNLYIHVYVYNIAALENDLSTVHSVNLYHIKYYGLMHNFHCKSWAVTAYISEDSHI